MSAPRVYVDISAARASGREAVWANFDGDVMNPGEARRLADELRIAAAFVDELAPPAALPRGGPGVALGREDPNDPRRWPGADPGFSVGYDMGLQHGSFSDLRFDP